MPSGSISQALQLVNPNAVVDSSFTYYFATSLASYASGANTPYYTNPTGSGQTYTINSADFVNLTSVSESASSTALTDFSNVSGVSFSYLNNSSADIVISGLNTQLYTGAGGTVGAFAFFPQATHPLKSDVFIPQVGATATEIYRSVEHELGHSIGLLDANVVLAGVHDAAEYTLMSYKAHAATGRQVRELQLYDIAALQKIYGRNDNFASGDTTISSFIETIPALSGQNRVYSIWDGSGSDTIDASSVSSSALIDLRPGYFSSIGNSIGVSVTSGSSPVLGNAGKLNISIAYGAYIENATGTSQGDVLIGNILSNSLNGGAGNDVIFGEGFGAIYDPGDGSYDRVGVSGASAAPAPVKMFADDPKKQRDILSGGAGDDTLYGGRGDDTLDGGAGTDYLRGGSGNDVLAGGSDDDFFYAEEGDDEIWGGDEGNHVNPSAEIDVVDYSFNAAPVSVRYDGSNTPSIQVTDGAGGKDTLHSIEKVVGTAGRDFVEIIGQIALGTDLTIDANGGQGASPRDTINLSKSATGTTVTLDSSGNGSIIAGAGREIKLAGFHTALVGSEFDDTIQDYSVGEKEINGGAGNDHISISGSSGDGLLIGGEGDDIITGGSGNDVIMGGNGSFVGYPFTPGYNPLYIGNQMFGGSGSDYIVSVSEYDYIEGGDGADYIELRYGLDGGENSTDNRVDAGAGNDVIDLRHRYTDHGYTNGRGAHLVFGAGSGKDVVLGNFTTLGAGKYNQVNLILNSVSADQLSLVWNVTLNSTGHFTGSGDLAIITPTGDSIYIPNVSGHISVQSSGTSITLSNVLVDGSYEFENFASISVGGVSQYLGAVEEFFGNTSSPGDVTGGAGNDHLAGSDGDDQVAGGAGDDTIEGSLGADEVDGGDGADTLELFGSVSDFQFRYEGSELVITNVTGIYGEIRATSVEYIDFLSSGQIYNTQGDLFGYIGTEANDFLIGSAVANNMIGLGGADSISGGGGGDFIDGGAGDDILDGGSGDDELAGGAGTDVLLGGNGNDLLRGGAGADQILGGAGIDTADYSSSSEAVQVALGGSANGGDAAGDLLTDIENLTGSSYDDTLEGNGGNNILTGGYGNDLIVGGDGVDQGNYVEPLLELLIGRNLDGSVTVTGSIYEPGDTLIGIEVIHSVADNLNLSVSELPIGTEGNDIIVGSQYSDILNGYGGDDVISTGGGSRHLIDGGAGTDQVNLSGSLADYSVFIDPDGAVNVWDVTGVEDYSMATLREIESIHFDGDNATLLVSSLPPVGTFGNDHIIGSSRNDVLIGLEGDDHLEGNGAYDVLYGEAGEDVIEGGEGTDELYGGDGNDTLEGGSGDDYLAGDDGVDVAIFAGNQADYSINIVDGVGQVEDLDPFSDGDDGVDWLEGVETLLFKDGSISLNSSLMRTSNLTAELGGAPTLTRARPYLTFIAEWRDWKPDEDDADRQPPKLELDAPLERGGRYRMKHAFDVPGLIEPIDAERYATLSNGAVQATASAFVQSIAAFTPVAAGVATSEHSEDHSRRDLWFAQSRAGDHLSSI